MKKSSLISIGAAMLGLAVMTSLIAWLGLPCGPSTCASSGWLYDFQTFVTGIVAAVAALGTVVVLRMQIRQASKDSAAALEANRKNLELQLLHEREIREAEDARQKQRETDSIQTILLNEANDLRVAFVPVRQLLDEMFEIHHEKALELRDVGTMGLSAALEKFTKRLDEADAAFKPLTIRYTQQARYAILEIRANCLLMNIAALGEYDTHFDEHMADAKARVKSIQCAFDKVNVSEHETVEK